MLTKVMSNSTISLVHHLSFISLQNLTSEIHCRNDRFFINNAIQGGYIHSDKVSLNKHYQIFQVHELFL